MRINKVTETKNFGIFQDFKWDSNISPFKRFNLIYGWNRSGKTIFSRIFSSCEKRTTGFEEYPENGKFQLETDNGLTIKNNDVESCNLPVKVFNKDFIGENISFDPSNHCSPIVYISKEDIESKKRLEDLKKDYEILSRDFENAKKEKEKFEVAEEKFCVATAQNIKTTIGSLKVRDKYYDYNKGNLKNNLETIGINNFIKLSDREFDKCKRLINGEVKQKQATFPKYTFSFFFNDRNISSFNDVYTSLDQILKQRVVSEIIERLKNDQDLNNWVQQGFDLHKEKGETEKCLFCKERLDDDFLDSLSKHFSKDYENLQNNLTMFITKLEDLKKEKLVEQNNNLYSDLQSRYTKQIKKLNRLIVELNEWIDKAVKKLQEKYSNPLSVVRVSKGPKDFEDAYNKIIKELNKIIKEHNLKVDDLDEFLKTAKKKLEHHLIAVAIKEQDYKKTKKNFRDSVQAQKEVQKKLKKNDEEIKNLEQKISNIGKAVQKINKHLEDFFGRREIQLELSDDKKGYIIKRNGQPAKNLCESEKTAIAFSYFIVKTEERDFKTKEGIIFIDDPISSLDSNFTYHCFSVIKNHFKNSGQLFISTHNFELFNLLKDWFCRKNRKTESKNKKRTESEKKPLPCEFYMIENPIKNNKRLAYLVTLEETLKNFKSEYHYLFFLLNRFVKKDEPKYSDYYIIGNIARRFLEIFISFKIPTTGDLSSKLDQLVEDTEKVSEIEKDKVYKLIQEFSHGLDLDSGIRHKDRREIKEAIKILLKIIERTDAKHFNLLKNNLPPSLVEKN